MRRVALLLILLLGCTTYRGSVKTAQVGGLALLGGFAVGALMVKATNDLDAIAAPLVVGGVGSYLLIGGLVGMLVHDPEPQEQETYRPPPGRRLAKRTTVRGMTPEEHAQCMEVRRSKLLAAQQIDDRKRRGEVLSKIQTCGQVEEVVVEVSAETGETAEETLEPRERAWEMTKRAGEAARAGDCPTVLSIGREVYRSDPEFHDAVFARDVATARCVWPTPAPASVAP